ncbi:hypothetical protein [Sporolactobacillus laevolacticus]|uniref:Uncharacterized protein n=1 Tax=Sporolactobacillus laevolacticus DSM 442 TaxID=1395513 RepID=V6IZ23_9BACL|nr:hypothetical protein [Sporolactobacillus laevolacticus]EST12778.1 hypothetical protein P343_06180 [Sporolactobacillus laevolacticus DSM 442]
MRKKKIIIFLLIIFIFSFWENKVSAFNLETVNFSPNPLKIYSDGVKVDLQSRNSVTYDALLDTSKKEKGVYTTSFYEDRLRNLNNYGAMVFDISNPNKTEMRFNFSFNTGRILVLKNGSFVALMSSSTSNWETFRVKNGTVSIPPAFHGKIYIPFASLFKSDKSVDLSSIKSWGISFTLDKNQKQRVKFGDFSFVTRSLADKENRVLDLTITGEESVQIPVAGESIAYYQIRKTENTENKPTLGLLGKPKGVTLDKNGTLTLTTLAKPQTIRLVSISPDGSKTVKSVRLIKSWIIGKKADDGISIQIPIPDKAPKIVNISSFLYSDAATRLIRYILIVIGLLLVLTYFWCRKKSKNKFINLNL